MLLLAALLAAQPPAAWPMDELTLRNGHVLRGLILEDTPVAVRFRVVNRSPGRPAVTFTTTVNRTEIAAVRPLPDAERAALREKVAGLDPGGVGERQRMAALALTPASWLGTPAAARQYESDLFVLISPGPEEVTRRAAVRLEQLFTAFARFLPPRRPAARPTTVYLAPDAQSYRALAGNVVNPAVYDPAANRIVLRAELKKAGDDLTRTRLFHLQQIASLDKAEADLRQLYRQPAELDRHLEGVRKERKRVAAAEAENDAAFDKAAGRTFARLYHEAFHAYAGTFAYPPDRGLPRWLNEGLAQVFETALLEAGELRVGHADRDRLDRAQALLKNGGLVPLRDLLRAGGDAFVAAHADKAASADRAYLSAWAVAFHLLFERRLLGTPAFDAYVNGVAGGADPVAAFATLVGKDAAAYEKELNAYLGKLLPDGTLRK